MSEVTSWSVAPSGAASDLHWQPAAASTALGEGEIHVWRVEVDQSTSLLDSFSAMLSEEECARARRFHFARDRNRFILRHGYLRIVLGHYLDVNPGELRFTESAFGKPELSLPAGSGLQFNLSHSEGLVLYAVTRGPGVGIDVERVRVIREAEAIAEHLFSAREVAELNAVPTNRRPEAFLKRWTCLEASAKASGRGLADSPNPIRMVPTPHGRDRVMNWREKFVTTTNRLYDLVPAPGYVAALATAEANPERESGQPEDMKKKAA